MERAAPTGGRGGVATSKFAVPRRRPDVIRRARLNTILDLAVGTRGTIIAAPAGYGKTTLVVDWLEEQDFDVAWLSLDEWDGDLASFASALAGGIGAAFGTDVPLGDERFWQPRTVGTVIVNTLAARDDYVVLVLDDVHHVQQDDAVMATLGLIVERAPENVHVVMTSRTRPPLPPLARLTARREVTTIGAGDLAFTAREIRELLAGLGRAVSEDEAEALFERTEGWAAALVLEGGETRPRSSATLSLADYVHGEALATVPDELRAFLKRVVPLPVWTPALCNEVSGRGDSERLLREAAQRVLFISQHADDPPLYRCHQLLRQLLMQRAREEDPDGFARAGAEAADALARHGFLNESVELLFELEAWERAAGLIEQIAPRLIQQGQARALAEWIDRLPAETQGQRPGLAVWRARASYKLQEFDEALRLIDDAVRALRERSDTRGLVQALFVRGETQRRKGYYPEALATFGEARTLLEFADEDDAQLAGDALRNIGVTHTITGDLDAAIEELEEARRLLEQVGDLQGIGNTCVSLAQCYSRRGEPHQALGALQRAQSAFERAGNTFDLGLTLNNTGMLYYELAQYEQALQVYERGLRLVRGAGASAAYEPTILAGIAETYRDMGRYDESLAAYQELQPMLEGLQVPYLVAAITEGHALTRMALGEGEEAARLLKTVAPRASDPPDRLAQHALAEGHIALERGDPAAALRAVDAALRHFESIDDRRGMALAAFLRARALYESHQPRKALSELERVAGLTEQIGQRRFLRPLAARAGELLEYARVRHIAEPLLRELAPEAERAEPRDRGRPAAAPDMLPRVRAFALGRGSVLVGERPVSDLEWRSEKSKEMFFFLLWRRAPVTKEEIFGALWPDLPESKCNSNFHSSLYRLRRALFHECVVRDGEGAYALNERGVFESDVQAFMRAMAEAGAARDEAARIGRLEEAIALYKGPFLSATYAEWVEPVRRDLEDSYVEALSELGARKLQGGAFEEALALFRALEGVDAYSDAAAYGVMRAHLGLNDPGAAARHYRRYRQLLKDELDEEPSERLTALYREAAGG